MSEAMFKVSMVWVVMAIIGQGIDVNSAAIWACVTIANVWLVGHLIILRLDR